MEKTEDVKLQELHVSKERGIEATFQGAPIALIADHLAKVFVAHGGENYVVLEFDHPELGPFFLTIQRKWGKEPHVVAAELRKEVERLTAVIASLAIPTTLADADG